MKFQTAKNRSDGSDIVAIVLYLGTNLSVKKIKEIMRICGIDESKSPLDIADWYSYVLDGNIIDFLKVWQDNVSQIQ